MIYNDIEAAINKFKFLHGVEPNVLILGSGIVHTLRHIHKYTMLYKPTRIEGGNMSYNNIPVTTDYERPEAVVVGLLMKER